MTVLVVDVFSEVLVPTPADLLARVFLDHDDRHDGAGGDYVKIFSIQTLFTTLKVSESMQGHSISGLNALILPPPMQLSDVSPDSQSWNKIRWLAYPSKCFSVSQIASIVFKGSSPRQVLGEACLHRTSVSPPSCLELSTAKASKLFEMPASPNQECCAVHL